VASLRGRQGTLLLLLNDKDNDEEQETRRIVCNNREATTVRRSSRHRAKISKGGGETQAIGDVDPVMRTVKEGR